MKMCDIATKYEALTALSKRDGLPFEMIYTIAANLNALETAMQAYQKSRTQIAMKYAEKDEDGKIIEKNGEVTLTDRTAFVKELSEILEKDIDFSDTTLRKIKKADIAVTCASVSELRPLMDMIEE